MAYQFAKLKTSAYDKKNSAIEVTKKPIATTDVHFSNIASIVLLLFLPKKV